jgi:hypothetical protein
LLALVPVLFTPLPTPLLAPFFDDTDDDDDADCARLAGDGDDDRTVVTTLATARAPRLAGDGDAARLLAIPLRGVVLPFDRLAGDGDDERVVDEEAATGRLGDGDGARRVVVALVARLAGLGDAPRLTDCDPLFVPLPPLTLLPFPLTVRDGVRFTDELRAVVAVAGRVGTFFTLDDDDDDDVVVVVVDVDDGRRGVVNDDDDEPRFNDVNGIPERFADVVGVVVVAANGTTFLSDEAANGLTTLILFFSDDDDDVDDDVGVIGDVLFMLLVFLIEGFFTLLNTGDVGVNGNVDIAAVTD